MSTLENLLSRIENVKVIDESIPYSKYTPIDLSVFNDDLSKMDLSNSQIFENFIKEHLQKNDAKIAFGGYNEVRNLYKSSTLFNDDQKEERNIHIGMDLWTKAETPILAALDGTVHSFDFNAGKGNYGPTIILKHHILNHTFYTLYGHLTAVSIENLEVGIPFHKGQKIATLGSSTFNGGYAPHLHFQIIKQIKINFGDFPGFCSKNHLIYYLDTYPNPNLLLKIQ
jgi:murein DD-endopeptidase MepM/ murein hydrolase activator NlpD